MIDYIEKAKAFAMMAHKGQTDKAGEDYFTAHVAVVADGVEPDPLVKAAAYLHDTVADTLGVSTQAVAKWQAGTALPTIDNLVILAAMLDTKIDDILVIA